jgi:hypothetical protein
MTIFTTEKKNTNSDEANIIKDWRKNIINIVPGHIEQLKQPQI